MNSIETASVISSAELPLKQNRAGSQRAAQLLMLASGFAGLGYQIVWTQQCALWLGHEAAAVLAVVAAFFGGLAFGALVLGQHIESSRNPVRWYASCELVIAMWSLLLALAMAPVSAWLLARIGAQPIPLWQWAMAFFGTFFLLLPATAAMGATLPAMERITAQLSIAQLSEGRSIAALYACNTLGAVLGVLAIAFWLIPAFGLMRTAAVCITLNLLCCVFAWRVFPAASSLQQRGFFPSSNVEKPTITLVARRAVLTRLALTGLLGIGYEVLVVRVLSQVAEDTVYTFAMLLAVYLIGSAIGAAIYQRWLLQCIDAEKLSNRLFSALATACLCGTASLWIAEHVKAFVLQTLSADMASAIAAETILAAIAFGPPTIVMGALFSHLSANANAVGISFGRALGINTVGAAIAPLLFGVLAFPLLGPKHALLLISVGYLLLSAPRTWLKPLIGLPASIALAMALWAPPLAFIDVPEGGRVVSYQEGVMAAVSVVEDADGVARLRIDNRQQEGSSSSRRVDARQAMLPILLHVAPKHVLFLGLGTGVTASAAAEDTTLQVDAVELLPEVISASHLFSKTGDASHPRLHLIAADARRYVRTTDQHYDVIISDNFHPARSGSGSLYTIEHFAAVRERLDAGGVFCQWLPLHQLDLDTLRSIIQSFIAVYPDGSAILASNSLETPVLGLIGRGAAANGVAGKGGDNRFDVDALRQHLATMSPPELPIEIGIDDEFSLLGSFIAGPQSLRRFAGTARANTDDYPIVAYRAPRITYAPDTAPRDRLIALLRELSADPTEIIAATSDQQWLHRLSAYWSARNRFIELGRDVRPSHTVQQMLIQVREPLLSVLRISPDFRPAYDPLLRMAASLARSDIPAARALLNELILLQPARPAARLLLQEIDSASAR